MTTTNNIEIPLSKGKLSILLLGSLIFVAIGIWLIINPTKHQNGIFGNATIVMAAGISSTVFFAFCAFLIFKKLSDKKPGLIIDDQGITDNASGISAGLIPWRDIKEIKDSKVMNQKFLLIIVNNPEEYIKRQKNGIKRKAAEMNYKSYGSPISISANSLKTSFDELEMILKKALERN